MDVILKQLSQLFVQSIPTVIFVFVLLGILERLLFRPLIATLKRREEATVGALTRAREQAAAAEAKTREYESAFQDARLASYRLREEERRAALSDREYALKRAREQTASWLDDAQASLRAEVNAVKRQLAVTSQSLAVEIAEAVLRGGQPGDRQGRAET